MKKGFDRMPFLQDKEILMGFMNLHDAFLNASLQYSFMNKCPVVGGNSDPEKFFVSNRGRFERAWVTFLYVLIESWQSKQMEIVRAYVKSVTDTSILESLLSKGNQDGSIAKMREARGYMCHRDRRGYWDNGRLAVIGNLKYHEDLHMAFSEVLIDVFKKNH